ncbi:TraC family protein, partial [Xenorhabdus sp. IM139775]|uniref:TraC family protein n=1 Tax=Xenorhabdus sp. IM139775 TaxID=3025876 RepID=UPI002358D7C2
LIRLPRETDKPICEQFFDYDTNLEVSKNGLCLGNYYSKVMSAKKLPDVFYFGDALTDVGDFSGSNFDIKENHMVVANVFFLKLRVPKIH